MSLFTSIWHICSVSENVTLLARIMSKDGMVGTEIWSGLFSLFCLSLVEYREAAMSLLLASSSELAPWLLFPHVTLHLF